MVAPRHTERPDIEGGNYGSHAAALLGQRPAWFADALCREYPDLRFVECEALGVKARPAAVAACLDVCGRCLVMFECRAMALGDDSLVGVFGGTDTAARRAMRANRKASSLFNGGDEAR